MIFKIQAAQGELRACTNRLVSHAGHVICNGVALRSFSFYKRNRYEKWQYNRSGGRGRAHPR